MKTFHPTAMWLSLILVVLVMNVISCKKNSNSTATYKVKTQSSGGNTNNYNYDSQGRLILVQVSTGAKQTYTYYASDSVVYNEYDSGATTPTITSTYILGSDGYTASVGNTIWTYVQVGELASIISPGDSIIHVWNNGNIVTQDICTSHCANTSYSYYSEIDSRDYGLQFTGNGSKNLKNLATTTYPNLNYPTEIVKSTYQFDNSGRVTVETDSGGGNVAVYNVFNYTYY